MKQNMELSPLTLVLRTMAVNRKRCFFGVIGIIVGIAAVTTLASLGYSSQRALADELTKLGTNMLIIEHARSPQDRNRQTLTESDVTVLMEQVDDIASIAPVFMRSGAVKRDEVEVTTDIVATRTSFMDIRNLDVSQGRLFAAAEDSAARRVVLLGQTVAALLFDGGDVVGERVYLNDGDFEVVGILTEKGLDAHGDDQDDIVIIPLTTAQQYLDMREHLTHIYIEATEAERIPVVKESIVTVLREAHQLRVDEPDGFNVLDQAQLLAARTDILGSLKDLANGVAFMTLLAGGFGITAVQLISLSERTWELGLHRALGARKKDITLHLLIESAILGTVGGIVGAIFGIIAPLVVVSFFSLTPAIAWPALALSLAASFLVGIAAGIYPAIYAVRLDPVVALRSA